MAHLSHPLPEKTVTLLWIPRHSGITGNEKADNLAKKSLDLPTQNHLFCPVTDIHNHLHFSFKRFLQSKWERTPHQHLIRIKPTLGHWSSANQNTRLREVTLSRLRIGHTKITHYYIFEREPPTICHRCNVRYNVAHMLIDCPLYRLHRQVLINYTNCKRIPFTLSTLLGDSHPELLEMLFIFLHNTHFDQFR